jgi:UDP-3-O-[3-hydroxymyristoyl] glucosamine N-acyltransferase
MNLVPKMASLTIKVNTASQESTTQLILGAKIGKNVFIGRNCNINSGATLNNCIIGIPADSRTCGCKKTPIIGKIALWARIPLFKEIL